MSTQRSEVATDDHSSPSFGKRLNALYVERREAGRKPCTDKDVAAAVSAIAGKSYSPQYMWALRRGRKTNPSEDLVSGLAEVFEVTKAYFYLDGTDDPTAGRPAVPSAPAASATTELDPAILKIAHRADGLSPHWLLTLDQLISHARQMEGLDDTDESR